MSRFASNIILIAVIFSVAQVKGQRKQGTVPVSEMVFVHTDRKVYVAGDAIRYKAYILDLSGRQTPCSKIIYFSLTGTGPDNNIVWRINVDSSSVSGMLPIPEDHKPGIYMLTAYTNWMRDNPVSTHYSDRIIITSLKSEVPAAMRFFETPPQHGGDENANQDVSLRIGSITGEVYAGGMVDLTLELQSKVKTVADLSVSVTAVSPFDSSIAGPDIVCAVNKARQILTDAPEFACRHKIEDRGYILSGRIMGLQGASVDRCDVWLAVRDSVTPRILFAPVDSSGNFQFFLNRSYDNKELIIQLADPSKASDCRIEIFDKKFVAADTVTRPYTIGQNETDYLNTVNNLRLVDAVYNKTEPAGVINSQLISANFLKMPNRELIPAEYEELRNFREIAGNILPEVRFGTRRNAFYLEVLSPNMNLWKANKILMLNGVPFTDLTYISTLGTKEIRRIEVIQPNILVGRITLPGLVSIFTYDNKIPEDYLRRHSVRYMNDVLPSVQRTSDINISKREIASNYPDFRSCVFWEPFVRVSSGEPLKISFPAGLLPGKFVIRVQGITAKGDPVNEVHYYQVN